MTALKPWQAQEQHKLTPIKRSEKHIISIFRASNSHFRKNRLVRHLPFEEVNDSSHVEQAERQFKVDKAFKRPIFYRLPKMIILVKVEDGEEEAD